MRPEHVTNWTQRGQWFPGGACPVLGCGAKKIRKVWEYKRHWREMHEAVVATFPCSKCSFFSKRRFDVVQHFVSCHWRVTNGELVDKNGCVGNVVYQENPGYVDPYPLTLNSVLKGPDCALGMETEMF
ncbi:hypothetical protein ElyMa_005542900 [Elysia marginata]|uniref:C2H2-type domain-containing protein n=1 Tax=Elysia marginata TaxID=1093978 RepID=A0AAV4EZ91_9GAST|nr:hypothetical protein ElyMa_005542900 [Elysia marginata]